MSRLVARHRPRWPVAALLAGSVVAAALTLVPARADALDASSSCAVTGFLHCYRVEIVQTPTGPEFRAFVPLPGSLPKEF